MVFSLTTQSTVKIFGGITKSITDVGRCKGGCHTFPDLVKLTIDLCKYLNKNTHTNTKGNSLRLLILSQVFDIT